MLHDEQHGLLLARLVITCCAADARPIEIGIQTAAPTPPVDSWVTVTGTYAGSYPGYTYLPVLKASTVTPVPEPANPYD